MGSEALVRVLITFRACKSLQVILKAFYMIVGVLGDIWGLLVILGNFGRST